MVGGVLWGCDNTCVSVCKVLIVLYIVFFGKVLLGVGVVCLGEVLREIMHLMVFAVLME